LSALKKLTLLAFAFITFQASSVAQLRKCATDEKMQELLRTDAGARLRYESTKRLIDQKIAEILSNPSARLFRTQAIINIPVVVHVAFNNPNIVTDAIIQRQLDTLNKYYGTAPVGDSLRVFEPFRTTYGRSQIRFCLAKRTPGDANTNGIERINTTSTYTSSGFNHPSNVAAAWDSRKYLNIWVVQFTDQTLGYSYLPGTFPPGDQRAGFVVDYRAFGSQAAHLYSDYNHGKTAVHEIGHFFGLQHTWGAGGSNPSCAGTDDCADTPPTAEATYGCPGSPVFNACSSSGAGVMWQNHMDYADDACMILFTNNQVTRMEAMLQNSADRSGLMTSNACQAATTLDASISAIVTPAAGVSCNGTVAPVVTVKNEGTSTLNSVRINVSVNAIPAAPFDYTGNIAGGASINLTLPALSLTPGNNVITISTSLPNGGTDQNTSNDSKTVTTRYATVTSLPLAENFEAATFPPGQWSVLNPDGDTAWRRGLPGRSSSGSLFINNSTHNESNHIDDFRSQPISTAGIQAVAISFDLAHKFSGLANQSDTLSILVSADCGATYQTIYKKWGTQLATAGTSTAPYLAPASGDWRTELVTVSGAPLASGQMIVVFRNTSRFGNNIFIDNINIEPTTASRNLQLTNLNAPAALLCNGNNITPSITVRNVGPETITGVKVSYSLDGGAISTATLNGLSIAPNSDAILDLPVTNIGGIGAHSIKIYTWEPMSGSGVGDSDFTNDTLSRQFYIAGQAQDSVKESFTGTIFPPQNWSVINPDGALTWSRNDNGHTNSGSAFMNSYNYNATGRVDILATPVLSYGMMDSVSLRFDVAAASRTGAAVPDTLEVMVTKDCGATYTTVYKKWGADLNTVAGDQSSEFFPAGHQWRPEYVNISQYRSESPIMVLFKATSNGGNNIFLDNINIIPRLLPAALKEQGYLLLPSPFTSRLSVWHVEPPADLKSIFVFNSVGQQIWSKQFNGNASNVETIDLTGKASGVYIVRLNYGDDSKSVSERVIKQ